MITIKISEPGHNIKFPKMREFRTPCKIETSNKDLNNVIIELKKLGIQKYTIISDEQSQIKKEPKPKIKEQIINKSSEDYSNLEKRFNILEELLKQALSKPTQIINKYGKSEEQEVDSKDGIIEELDDFIPSIDLKGMEIKGSSFKIQKSTSDVKETSDLLSKLVKKPNKFK